MGTNQAVAPAVGSTTALNFNRVLGLPWLDRTIAIIACGPIMYLAYYRVEHGHLGIPLIAAVFQSLLLIATMMIRRPPVRVTPNPLYWLLAFVATYWPVLILTFIQQGRPLTLPWITDSISILGLLITVWARLSLGRNIGFVPAQRQLVGTGAYSYMRHPIYTGGLFLYTALTLRTYSPRNALLTAIGILWFIPIKSLVEENFLRADPQYAEYMRKVRARWIPFVI
jgi:protein-S-isoprenylcysteine O-methyltransferase Ste14